MAADVDDVQIGADLRMRRQAAGLSLARAAELTGVSKAMLGQIERGESSPTLATLWKVAKGFRLPLTCLITGDAAPVAENAPVFSKEIAVATVFAFDPWRAQETFEVTLQPGQTHLSDAHMSGVWEDVVLLEGGLDMQLDGQWQAVPKYRGLRFRGDRPHGYRAGPEGSTFLSTMHYPAGERAGERDEEQT